MPFSNLFLIEVSEKKLVFQKLAPKIHATDICLHFFENQNYLLWNIIQLDKVCGTAFVKKKGQKKINNSKCC